MARSVPSSVAHAPNDLISSALWNSDYGSSNTYLTTVPMFAGYLVGTQVIPNGIPNNNLVGFNASALDTDTGHSITTENSRYTCQVPGWYLVSGQVTYPAGGTAGGSLRAFLAKNGNAVDRASIELSFATSWPITVLTIPAKLVQMALGDYVEIITDQVTGGPMNTSSAALPFGCGMTVFWVAHY